MIFLFVASDSLSDIEVAFAKPSICEMHACHVLSFGGLASPFFGGDSTSLIPKLFYPLDSHPACSGTSLDFVGNPSESTIAV
jgi:hypothetical protein